MPREEIYVATIEEAVESIIPYLEDMSITAHRAIYFGGWHGLAASAVLRTIAEDPLPSLLKKFNKIIHVDCSRWKSRRELQRTIAQELKLPRRVMDIFDRQDEEDDFRGIHESSRAEIQDVAVEIYHTIQGHVCLVIFHNGSHNTIDLNDFGIPLFSWFGNQNRVLWTFRGRLRLNPGISETVDKSHLFVSCDESYFEWDYVLQNEFSEIVGYTDKAVTRECCLYLLSLNSQGGDIMDYNWATHASNYWVCDGIIQGGHADEAWEVALALHHNINVDDYSSNILPSFGDKLKTPPKRWILSEENSIVHPESTSVFLAAVASESDPPLRPLPNDMFHQSDKLRVLKLCRCTFNFSSPPFCCCRNLKFLGLDDCKDQQEEEDEKQDRPAMEFFQSLWVLDICHTDWELNLSADIIEQMAANIREVHINKGRIWCHSFAWRQLQNLHKLRVREPTSPWQTGKMDEFTDMMKLEFLDLSGDSTIQVLPCLSGATGVKILVLDGCIGLKHVGPEGLPMSLESFSLDVGTRVDQNEEAKISHISFAGCGKLMKFRLYGSLPNLEELDLSGTLVKTLDLKEVQAPSLQQIVLLGCRRLHAILWPKEGLPALKVLHIDLRSVDQVQTKLHEVYVTIMDIRFFQSLVLQSNARFCWKSNSFHLNLYVPYTTNLKGQSYRKEKMGPGNSGQIMGPPQPESLTPNTYSTYIDVSVGNIIVDHNYNSGMQFQVSDCHVEIGKGISNGNVDSEQAIKAIFFAMNEAKSLHVHDNPSIASVIPKHMISTSRKYLEWNLLKQCHVVRCPKMHTVFTTDYNANYLFREIETFLAADLLMAHCIWSKGRTFYNNDIDSFGKLRSIHLYSCPRLTFVLPLLWAIQESYLRNLESLHIVNCGDLKTVFPVHPDLQEGVLEFPSLKHIHLYELCKLQHICEVKMLAPKLERVWLRGCWGLRRLPAIGRDSRPVVDCEKDWWERLKWDGLEAGHDPSLFQPCHSSYYKKPLDRVSVLR